MKNRSGANELPNSWANLVLPIPGSPATTSARERPSCSVNANSRPRRARTSVRSTNPCAGVAGTTGGEIPSAS